MAELMGWGRYPRVQGHEELSEDLEAVSVGTNLARGLGRSYGDSSLPARPEHRVLGTRLANRVMAFDRQQGRLRAEAGFTLGQLHRLGLTAGWSCPVNPGTQQVTLGGMVAADVHGKNHHQVGCIGEHVTALTLRVADGRLLRIGPEHEAELFWATVGGMGLTGQILDVELQLASIESPWVLQEAERKPNLDELLDGLKAASARWPFTVCWVDALSQGSDLGRGVVIRGRWATRDEAPNQAPRLGSSLAIPWEMPSWLLSRRSVRAFNALYYRAAMWSERGPRVVNPQSFFHPLDRVQAWNRLYGAQGFIQYQCVLPAGSEREECRRFMTTLTSHGGASFLAVIKDCGPEGKGILSFPMPGISIALDVAMRGDATQRLVDALNEVVIQAGGRIYLAKDALTRREHFEAMEPRLARFDAIRRRWDPDGRLVSAQSARLLGDTV